MIDSTYAKAYKEVLEIIRYFPPKEYAKIPEERIEFYQKNMDKDYNFIINPEIDLSEQNIFPEANAIIVNLFSEYFATEEQKVKIKEILNINQKKEEQEKREKYNPDNIFKKNKNVTDEIMENQKAMVEYKENIIIKILNKLKGFFKKY